MKNFQMIRPIVKTFLWKYKLRIGCIVIAIFGMVVAGICLFWNVLYLSILAGENAFYFIFFLFMTAVQVVDFTFHLLLYFAAKKGDILIMMASLYYLCVKIFVIDVILIIVILVEYPNMLAMGIFFVILFLIRIYFFIIVYSSYAVLLQRKSTHEVLGSLEPSEDLWRNPTGQVAPASSGISSESEILASERQDKINLGVL